MTAEQIREHLRKQPFQPFRIHMSDGSSYEVPHPEFAWVTRREVMIGVPATSSVIPEGAVYCDPLHITRIELLPETKSRRRRNGR
jgi:hypothetical protein